MNGSFDFGSEEVIEAQKRADEALEAFLATGARLDAERVQEVGDPYADLKDFSKPLPWFYRLDFLPGPVRFAMNWLHCTITGISARFRDWVMRY